MRGRGSSADGQGGGARGSVWDLVHTLLVLFPHHHGRTRADSSQRNGRGWKGSGR